MTADFDVVMIGAGHNGLTCAAYLGMAGLKVKVLKRRKIVGGARCSICIAKSAGDYLDGFFESDPVKALFGFDAIVGNYASSYGPGSAYVLLHHCFGEVNGKKGLWGHAIGGMGAITQAMAKAARVLAADHKRRIPR